VVTLAFEIIGGIEAGRFFDKIKLCSLSPNLEIPERLLHIQLLQHTVNYLLMKG
jgi:hypothetical protein